jgi:tetratricopeptide (TPR) repeat protein
MPPHFTGRADERKLLSRWLNGGSARPLLLLQAPGGCGKSALAWHWLLHDVKPVSWPHVVWWSFYEADASFDRFLAETLLYLSGGKIEPEKLHTRDVIKTFVQLLRQPGILLVLDGFERALRAGAGPEAASPDGEAAADDRGNPHERDCLSPLAELFLLNVAMQPLLRSKVLLTTRLCPRILEAKGGGFLPGCFDEELKPMPPAEAVAFFHAQGIRGAPAEIEEACVLYGCHPLSLRLLAGLITGDDGQPGDIAVARRLNAGGAQSPGLNQLLQAACDRLTPARRALLGRIACFRNPVKFEVLKTLEESGGSRPEAASKESGKRESGKAETESPEPNAADKDQSSATGVPPKAENRSNSRAPLGMGPETPGHSAGFNAAAPGDGRTPGIEKDTATSSSTLATLDADLRDLVARGLLHYEPKEDRFEPHPIVRRHLYSRLSAPDRAAIHARLRDYFAALPAPARVTRPEELAPVIEHYHHTARAGRYDEALALFRERLYDQAGHQLGAHQLVIDLLRALFPEGEDHPPRLTDERDQAWVLNTLAGAYGLGGQPLRGVLLFAQQNVIRESPGDPPSFAIGAGNAAILTQINTGALRAAEGNLRRRIGMCRGLKNEFQEAIGRLDLGRLLACRGEYAGAETEVAAALKMFEEQKKVQAQGIAWACRTQSELLRLRSASDSSLITHHSPLASARRTLELAEEWQKLAGRPGVRDAVRAHWLLGAAHRVAGQTDEAEQHLNEALEDCRSINAVDGEADILIELARLYAGLGAPEEAWRFAEDALVITERSSYVLQGADVCLEFAKLALARGDKTGAKNHATEALRLAACDGPPDYTYQAAYAEAAGLLKQF